MRARFALLFPYLCLAAVLAIMFGGSQRRSLTLGGRSVEFVAGGAARSGSAPIDPVCGMEVGTNIESRVRGRSWYFCADRCRTAFNENPGRYLREVCLVCRGEKKLTPVAGDESFQATWQGKSYRFCSAAHRDAFRQDPARHFMHSMWGIPGWLYYSSVAMILVLSFGVFERRSARKRAAPGAPGLDLLEVGWIKRLLASRATRFTAQATLVALFLGIISAGLFGNQLPSKNIAPLLTWTIWWGGLIWLVAYFGKMWCYACPWDAIAEWAEGARLWGKKKTGLGLGLPWPRILRNVWPATVLFIGLTWIELGFGVTLRPRATAWLALAMLGLAFTSVFIFDRKSFCRYGCLVGRVSGLYALFAPVELRARDREVCRSCDTQSCYRGNDNGEGCPTFEFPARMEQNTYCIMCMECVKTCESDNIALRLRPWGHDLLAHRKPRSDEAYLALIMLSLTGLHGLTMTGAWRDMLDRIGSTLGVGEIAGFSIGMSAVMLAPVILYGVLVAISRWAAGAATVGYRQYFIRYAYALLPIALFYHLAHNSEHLLMEGQKALILASDPLGREWNLFGTAGWSLSPLVNLPTLWLLQVLFVTIGHVYSLWAARRAATALFPDSRAALRSQLPMLAAMILFSLMSLWLLKQPMEMRTSAM